MKTLKQVENPYYNELLKIKTSEELNLTLGLYQLLRKDYKTFKFKSDLIGISSLELSVPKVKTLGNLFDEINLLMIEKSLLYYMLISTVRLPEN